MEVPNEGEVSVGVECATCGTTLSASYNRRSKLVQVEPCEKCLEMARDEAYHRRLEDKEAE